eukprot:TRINITY_DN5141_c0_g1_i2.p1 TRINITY_DN5141_c0_g1~~TRINITY_DN5141_c0_g1_i2.p1  ORF type:complete len:681 (-),score=152.84 TRINITY_DN5141_c0_g1_i2:52-2094(-)
MFAWGKAANGRLGIGDAPEVVAYPREITAIKGPVSSIACGFSHSLCLTDRRELYTWGKGQDGQLGHGTKADSTVPRRVEYFAARGLSVATMSGGYFHTAAVTDEGELYAWGYGEYGQLGHGGTESEFLPRKVDAMTGKLVCKVACGGMHTLILDTDGRVYSTGSGEYGQLGLELEEGLFKQTGADAVPNTQRKFLSRRQRLSMERRALRAAASQVFNELLLISNPPPYEAPPAPLSPPPTEAPPSPPRKSSPSPLLDEDVDPPSATSPPLPTSVTSPEVGSLSPAPLKSPDTALRSPRSPLTSLLRTSFLSPSRSPSFVPRLKPGHEKVTTPSLITSLHGHRVSLIACGYWHTIAVVDMEDNEDMLESAEPQKSLSLVAGNTRYTLATSKQDELEECWLQLLSSWDRKKAMALRQNGIPPRVRGRVWSAALGNNFGMTPAHWDVYEKYAKKEMATKSWNHQIDVDMPRTFPHLFWFADTGPFYQQVVGILTMFTHCRPDIGYVQGMSHLAGVLIMNMEPYDAFSAFVNLITGSHFLISFYKLEKGPMDMYYRLYDLVLEEKLPKLNVHFQRFGIRPDYFLLDWFLTLFTRTTMLPVSFRIWDHLMFDGTSFVLQTTLGILKFFQRQLLATQNEEECVHAVRCIAKAEPDEDEIMACILSVQMPPYVETVLSKLATQTKRL